MPVAQRFQAGIIGLMNVEERKVMLDVLQRVYKYMAAGAGRV
jgi:hypothetical protein